MREARLKVQHKIEPKKNYNPDLVAFCDIQSGNGAQLFWKKDTGEVNKKGKNKLEKKEASYQKQKEASNKENTFNKQSI